MKVAYIPRPGYQGGPCAQKTCQHEACEIARSIATSKCSYCPKIIGYGAPFYDIRSPRQVEHEIYYAGYAHRDCHERARSRGAAPSKAALAKEAAKPTAAQRRYQQRYEQHLAQHKKNSTRAHPLEPLRATAAELYPAPPPHTGIRRPRFHDAEDKYTDDEALEWASEELESE